MKKLTGTDAAILKTLTRKPAALHELETAHGRDLLRTLRKMAEAGLVATLWAKWYVTADGEKSAGIQQRFV
jgi:predicted DNA-binding ArsR family transcriptional regulator